LAVPPDAGTYTVWVCLAQALTDALAIDTFKNRVPSAPTEGDQIVGPLVVRAPGCDMPGIRVSSASPSAWESRDPIGGTLTLQMWNQTACPGCVDKAVVGIRNSAGAWVGGEPQVIKTDIATTCAPGTTYPGLSFNNLAVPPDAGTYTVWVCLAQALTDALAIDTFKNRVPSAPTETDRIVGPLVVQPPPDHELVLHLKFDGNARDSSLYGNDGTVHGAIPTEDRNGTSGGALLFSDGQYVEVPDSASVRSPSQEVTVTAWTRIDALYGGVWAPVLCKSANPSNVPGTRQYCLEPYGAGETISAFMFGDGIAVAADSPVALGKWCHLAFTYGSQGGAAYVNSVEVGRTPYVGLLPVNTDPLQIGRDIPGSTEYLVGAIDEIRIYNRALSAVEIRALYQDLDLTTPVLLPGGVVRLECGRLDGQAIGPTEAAAYVLQVSDDLKTWSDVAEQPDVIDGRLRFDPAVPSGASAAFFRMVRR
ncbi:MAG TPA: LamG domain-containing protein, partial [Verrucomicrobiota bacterium]|nr:LamG domain-containing protein [Verrucomicrobiota bacterium]